MYGLSLDMRTDDYSKTIMDPERKQRNTFVSLNIFPQEDDSRSIASIPVTASVEASRFPVRSSTFSLSVYRSLARSVSNGSYMCAWSSLSGWEDGPTGPVMSLRETCCVFALLECIPFFQFSQIAKLKSDVCL